MTDMGAYLYNPGCGCDWCRNGGNIPQGTPSNGHSFGYDVPHVPPSMNTRDQTAMIGHAPEHRSFFGTSARGLPPDIHPTARVEAYVTVDSGVDRPTKVGARTWLMKKVHVGHDARIGSNCDLAPMANIGGYAEVGDNVKIGMSAIVLPYRVIGDGARIGAGAVVTKNVPAGETWAGNPARRLEDNERDHRPHNQRGTGVHVS